MEEFKPRDKRLIIRHYDSGAEMSVVTERNWKYRERVHLDRSTQKDSVKASAVSRAKTTVLRRCMAMGAWNMFTLTMPGDDSFNTQTLEDAWRMQRLWMKRCKRAGYNFPYVITPEKQKRGAWHFHLATNQVLPVQEIELLWNAVGGGHLNVDPPKRVRRASKLKNKVENLALYLAKYIGKEMEGAEFGRQRYRTSEGITIDREDLTVPQVSVSGLYLLRKTFQNFTGFTEGTIKLFDYVTCICTWGDNDVLDLRTLNGESG